MKHLAFALAACFGMTASTAIAAESHARVEGLVLYGATDRFQRAPSGGMSPGLGLGVGARLAVDAYPFYAGLRLVAHAGDGNQRIGYAATELGLQLGEKRVFFRPSISLGFAPQTTSSNACGQSSMYLRLFVDAGAAIGLRLRPPWVVGAEYRRVKFTDGLAETCGEQVNDDTFRTAHVGAVFVGGEW